MKQTASNPRVRTRSCARRSFENWNALREFCSDCLFFSSTVANGLTGFWTSRTKRRNAACDHVFVTNTSQFRMSVPSRNPRASPIQNKHLPRLWLSRRLLELLRDEDKDEDDRVPPTRLESEGPPTQPASQTAKQ